MQAYVITGSEENQKKHLDEFQKKHNILSYQIVTYEALKIGEVRIMQKSMSLKPGLNEKKVIAIKDPTIEAQNALLKQIEELPEYIFVFFLVTSGDSLIPTILSRCLVVNLGMNEKKLGNDIDQAVNTAIDSGLFSIPESFGQNIELNHIEEVILSVRRLIHKSPSEKTLSVIKRLDHGYKLAKNNNINKRMVLENAFMFA